MDVYLPEEARLGATHARTDRTDGLGGTGPVRLAWQSIARRLTGRLRWLRLGTALSAVAAVSFYASGALAQVTLLNVSYDPTRELYREFNAAFNAHWQAEGHAALSIQASHGGSGAQARAVIDGLEAQVVTLALASDIDAIAEKSGKIPADWQSKLPHNSAPYTSTIVFLVREGNPKGIEDWGDLVSDDVQVITPNPKTSGGARWNYLAAWAWADKQFGGNQDQIRDYMRRALRPRAGARHRRPRLDHDLRPARHRRRAARLGERGVPGARRSSARTSSTSCCRRSRSSPSRPWRWSPGNISSDEQGEAAQAYLEYLYSPEGQAIALKHYFRAWDTSAADPADVDRFPELELVSIADFGGWAEGAARAFRRRRHLRPDLHAEVGGTMPRSACTIPRRCRASGWPSGSR